MPSDSERPLAGQTALVTGASSGIGAATVKQLAADGAAVVLAARSEDDLESIAADVEEATDAETRVVRTDVTDPDQVAAAVEVTVETFGSLDIVVANAGLGIDEPVEEISDESYRMMMDVNVDGAFYTARAALPHLREGEGSLVFVSSFSGQYPRPKNPVYAATKWWIRGFALSLQGAVGEDDIGITQINPTEVRTEFGSEDDNPMNERFEQGEVTEASEVAEAIAFAVAQDPPTHINSIDIYRRDKFSHF
ncbi:SDR family oxidoreductase [Haloarcula brevis]|uniref:SDR family oxidoreductase n=1 Tax=Haloarcula brevis TaxID=3111453 RepID=UPI00300F225F